MVASRYLVITVQQFKHFSRSVFLIAKNAKLHEDQKATFHASKMAFTTIRASRKRFKKAFTLPEVLVAMSILVLVIFAATGLYVTSLRSNNVNLHMLVAYGLTQEVIEATRNIRDSNWILNATAEGTLSNNTIELWGARLPLQPGEEHYYTLDLGETTPGQSGEPNPASLLDHVPWRLKEISKTQALNPDDEETLLYQFHSNEKFHHYGYVSLGLEKSPTIFHRYLIMQRDPAFESNQIGPLRITGVVTWKEALRQKEVRFETQLTDWKEK